MPKSVPEQLINVIVAEWKKIPETERPLGVWIREYPPLPQDSMHLRAGDTPLAAWYLDAAGVFVRDIADWEQFQAASKKKARGGPTSLVFEVGYAAFTAYQTDDAYWRYYSEIIYGPLWGRGWRWHINEYGKLDSRELTWLS